MAASSDIRSRWFGLSESIEMISYSLSCRPGVTERVVERALEQPRPAQDGAPRGLLGVG